MYFDDFETKCREQVLHCDFPITLNNAIIMMTVFKTSKVELRNEIKRKNGDLKSVRETCKAFEIASEGSQMMKSAKEEKSQDKGDPELKRVYTPGRLNHTADHLQTQARPPCSKCRNEAQANRDPCPATGRRCLKCGRPNHFCRMCKGATNNRGRSQEEEFLEDVYLYQLPEGKSQNPTVAIHVDSIPISLHLDTQTDVTSSY